MAVKQYQATKGSAKVNPADMKACMAKQKGMPPFIARNKCIKQLGGAGSNSSSKKGDSSKK